MNRLLNVLNKNFEHISALFICILIFSSCFFIGCEKSSQELEKELNLAKQRENLERQTNKHKTQHSYGGSIWTERYNGHDYVLVFIDRGAGITHSASCHCHTNSVSKDL